MSLRDLLDELGIAQATIVGHSLGGGVAMQFLYQHPDYCERLILISSGGLGTDVGLILRLLSAPGAEFVLPVIAPTPVLKVGNKIGSWFTSAGMQNPRGERDLAGLLVVLGSPDPRRLPAYAAVGRRLPRPGGQRDQPPARPLRTADAGHLGRGRPDHPRRARPRGHGGAPGGRLEVLPGVGHFAHVEAPNEVAEIIDDFMRSTKHDTGMEVEVEAVTPPTITDSGK